MSVKNIAYFITPHGFGHATRAAAVMQHLQERCSDVMFHIYTKAPRWIFDETLISGFIYYPMLTDVGFIQKNPLEEDIDKTIQALAELYPPDPILVNTISNELIEKNISLVVCDIAPLGILAAKKAGIPSVLVENFTWDWIYEGYRQTDERFIRYIQIIQEIFDSPDFHIQTEPVCLPQAHCHLVTNPVSRKLHTPRQIIRNNLGIPPENTIIYLAFTHINPDTLRLNESLLDKVTIIVQGLKAIEHQHHSKHLIILPEFHTQYNPDLVHSSDVVVAKVGYSTIAEIYYAPTRFLYVPRSQFPESAPLSHFVDTNLTSCSISTSELENGTWINKAVRLIEQPVHHHAYEKNGAEEICDFLIRNTLV